MRQTRAGTFRGRLTQLAADPNPQGHDVIVAWVHANATTLVNRLWPRPPMSQVKDQAMAQLTPRLRAVNARIEQLKDGLIPGSGLEDWKRSSYEAELKRLLEWWAQYREAWPTAFKTEDIKVIGVEWEKPISSGRSVVGFIDLAARIHFTWYEFQDGLRSMAYPDPPRWKRNYEELLCCFEVKSQIRSIGDVIRQIQFYREYLSEANFVVVSPDTQFRDVLDSQGIHFIQFSAPLPGQGGASLEQLGLTEGA